MVRPSESRHRFEETVYTAYTGSTLNLIRTHFAVYGGYTIPTTEDYDMRFNKTIRKQDEVLGGFDLNNYTAKQVWVTVGMVLRFPCQSCCQALSQMAHIPFISTSTVLHAMDLGLCL